MNEKQTYYFITVFERLSLDEYGFPDTGHNRCWGFYTDKNMAIDALHENATDMNETMYEYAIVEEYYEGISNFTGFRQFFKYSDEKDGYFEIDEPTNYEYYVCFSIG